jgi:hypothetical protein
MKMHNAAERTCHTTHASPDRTMVTIITTHATHNWQGAQLPAMQGFCLAESLFHQFV